MKLTFEIPDEHALAVLRFLASLMPSTVDVTPDIAPEHPELPLGLDAAPKVAAPDVPPGFRALTLGEVIQDGDVFDSGEGKDLKPSLCVGQIYSTTPAGDCFTYHLPHFRPLAELIDANP